jgi:hypothetical protein
MTSSRSAVIDAVPLVTLMMVESVRCSVERSLLYLQVQVDRWNESKCRGSVAASKKRRGASSLCDSVYGISRKVMNRDKINAEKKRV